MTNNQNTLNREDNAWYKPGYGFHERGKNYVRLSSMHAIMSKPMVRTKMAIAGLDELVWTDLLKTANNGL